MEKIKKYLKIFFWFFLVLFFILALKLFLFSKKPIPVKVYKVKRGTIEEIVTNTKAGTLKARKRAKLSPRTSGLVVSLPKKKGEFAYKGELLLKIEDSIQRANLEAAEKRRDALLASFKEVEVALNLAIKEEKRAYKLFQENIISEEIYDRARAERERLKANLNSTKALLKQAEAEVKLAQEQIKLTEIYAPFDGYISEIYTEIGEWITPSFPGIMLPPVMEIIDLKELYVIAPIDEMDSKKIRIGDQARVTIDSLPSRTFQGRVSKIGVYVQDTLEQNRTVEVEIELDLEGESALPGTSADVEIISGKKENVLLIETSSIIKDNTVFVLKDGKAYTRKIKIGLQNWENSEVLEGLEEGEIILSLTENIEIKEGRKVKPINYD